MGMRKCSQCGKTDHNSRTCKSHSAIIRTDQKGQSMKLFGVELVNVVSSSSSSDIDGYRFKKSLSFSSDDKSVKLKNGYFCHEQRKKGVPWSEEEHKLFLLGLEKLGKGDWRGISRNFVTTRTSTQVASHAQKYFLRKNNANKNKIRHRLLSEIESSSIAVASFSKENCIKKPIPTLSAMPFCKLFNGSVVHNPPSLDLSLAAPLPLQYGNFRGRFCSMAEAICDLDK